MRFQRALNSKEPANWKHTLDFMFKNQILRNSKFIGEMKEKGLPESTAARYVRELLKAGLLEELEKASGRRPVMYSLRPLLELVREI